MGKFVNTQTTKNTLKLLLNISKYLTSHSLWEVERTMIFPSPLFAVKNEEKHTHLRYLVMLRIGLIVGKVS